LGSRERGFQGEDYFTAPNPEYGVVIRYWLKDGVTSLRAERERQEREMFKKGEVFGYQPLSSGRLNRRNLLPI
jgi:hypothetical protein